MANPKTVFSEIFYHQSSALRFELSTYKDATKFKVEVVPQAKDANGNPIEKKFDYDNKLSMLFGTGEILRMKKFVENILNPQKELPELEGSTQTKRFGYQIDHFFEVSGEKKKSSLIFARVDNMLAKKPDLFKKSPYQFKYSVMITLYSSLKKSNVSFVASEEEAYFIANMMPQLCMEYMKEITRVTDENRGQRASSQAEQPKMYTPAPGADASGLPGSVDSGSGGFDETLDFTDIPLT